jgi:light-regulated signal transduction histidine kinase (bacteriophytochrome)
MSGSLILNADFNLMNKVSSSLQSLRKLLQGGIQTKETRSQIRQLKQLEQLLVDQAASLDAINKVLDEFNQSVAHELFAPLRRISGFSRELKLRFAEEMGSEGVGCLSSIMESTRQMNELIDALMQLSRMSHAEFQPVAVDLSEIAGAIAAELTQSAPQRPAVFAIAPQLRATGDAALLKVALRKLLENAWKYTARAEAALIELGRFQSDADDGFYIKDNGVGFDMADYGRLFHPFQRLHDPELFPGSGIGLLAVKRIIDRHGGRIWAEAVREQGATFYFTL